MAPTLVNAAVGVLLGLALLGAAFDRRSIVVVAIAAASPDLDAVAGLVVDGATNALFHTLLVPAVAFVALSWDANYRDRSRLRDRYGWYGVRVAWVALAAYAVAGIGLDLFTTGVNLLYPLHDRFYVVSGRLLLSTQEGFVQTIADGGTPLWLSSPGTTETHRVETWLNPSSGTGFETGDERRLHLIDAGWQLPVVAAAVIAAAVRLREVR